MKELQTPGHRILRVIPIISLLLAVLTCLPVYGEDIPGVIGQYDNWDLENTPTVGAGLFPAITLEPKEESSLSSKPVSGTTSSKIWVTISPFISTLSGKETNLIIGYMSGARADATLTIAGKRSSDSDYTDLATISPDENGLFIWPVPTASSTITLFRATAKTGTDQAISNAIRFTPASSKDPVIKPVVTQKSTPVQTIIPMATHESSLPDLTRLTISASTTSPKVGDQVVISGRLTDMDGTGISGATVTIDETGYPGASTGEPFQTTQTGSDGRFTFTLSVRFANMVGLVANYAGDGKHQGSESNTLTFTSYSE